MAVVPKQSVFMVGYCELIIYYFAPAAEALFLSYVSTI